MTTAVEKTCYDILLQSGAVPRAEIERLFHEAESAKASFTQLLVKSGLMREPEMLELFSKHFGIPFVQLKLIQIDKSILEKVPVKFANYYGFFPIKFQNRKLTIAVSRILELGTLDEIRMGLGVEIEPVLSPSKDIEEMIKRYYGLAAETVDRIMTRAGGEAQPAAEESSVQVEDIEKIAGAPSVIQLVNQIILEAHKKGASDIHLEPFRGRVRLRYRIDGVLHEANVPPDIRRFFLPIISRIKIMSNLNIVERRLPLDGKARVRVQDQTLDLRVSSIPTPFGESLVIRILPNQMVYGLEQLGLEADHLKSFQELIRRPNGIIFLTGPTGSGKSTTLYSALNTLNQSECKIITIEDPVEYEIEGITQIQVMPEVGLTFARGLRSMLRHDPDVMMVGEVRDLETADIAIRVALTGHLILSTLHTNDAASGVTRLADIGVQPYLIASSVVAFIAQRLVRRICPHCKRENTKLLPEVRQLIRHELGLGPQEDVQVHFGMGCDECAGTGYKGRIAIHEVLVVGEEVRRLVYQRAASEEIKRTGRQLGMRTLRQDGWKKVLRGITTLDEIMEVTPADEIMSLVEKPEARNFFLTEPPPPSKVKKSFQEQRKYIRTDVKFPLTFRLVIYEGGQVQERQRLNQLLEQLNFSGDTKNLSASGVAFVSYDSVKPNDVLELRLELPDGERPVQCIGRVLRVHQSGLSSGSKDGFSYDIAVTFLAINSMDRLRIENFCKSKGQS